MRRLTADDIHRGSSFGPGGRKCAMSWTKAECLVKVLSGKKLAMQLARMLGCRVPEGRDVAWDSSWGEAIVRWNDMLAKDEQEIADMLNAAAESEGLLPPLQAEIDTVLETELAVVQEKEELVCVG